MREIIFRGKRLDNGQWVEGYYAKFEQLPNYCIYYVYKGHTLVTDIDPETVCQYTGLTDKNGRKIFEGDILRFVNHINNNEWLCAVEFLEGSFICRYIYKDGELGEYNHFASWHEKVKWEVIGNIFDNPELLEAH